jgi:hypothetical protein
MNVEIGTGAAPFLFKIHKWDFRCSVAALALERQMDLN